MYGPRAIRLRSPAYCVAMAVFESESDVSAEIMRGRSGEPRFRSRPAIPAMSGSTIPIKMKVHG